MHRVPEKKKEISEAGKIGGMKSRKMQLLFTVLQRKLKV